MNMHESFFCFLARFCPYLSLCLGCWIAHVSVTLAALMPIPSCHSIRAGASALGCWFPASRGFAAASKDALLTATGLGLSYNG